MGRKVEKTKRFKNCLPLDRLVRRTGGGFSCNFVTWCIGGILFFASCNPPELKNPSPAINTIKSGEKFCIILPENHSESFVWRLDQSKKKSIDYVNAVWHGNEKGIYYHFQAKSSGQDTLNFALYKFNDLQRYTSYIVKVE